MIISELQLYLYRILRSQSRDKSQIAIAMKCIHCKEPEDPESCWNKFNRATWIYLEVLNCAACISENDDAKLWNVASYPCDFVFVLPKISPDLCSVALMRIGSPTRAEPGCP